MELLQDRFVLATRNIEREGHVGLSHGYACDQTAVGTTNGAGGRNVQILVLDDDLTVLHALPGFWHAADLLPELRLALDVARLHDEERMPAATKQRMFTAMHRAHVAQHGAGAELRGAWQSFDERHELERARKERRDTARYDAAGNPVLKTIPDLVHERMAARPFRKLADFEMEAFVDYGRPFYDNNAGLDRGKDFAAAAAANQKRERAQAKAEKEAAAQAARDAKKLGKAALTGWKQG